MDEFVKKLKENGFSDVAMEDNMLTIYLSDYATEGKEKDLKKQMERLKRILNDIGYKRSYMVKNPCRKK